MRNWIFDEDLFVYVLVFDRQAIGEIAYRSSSDKWVAMTQTSDRFCSSFKQAVAWVERNA